MLWPGKGVAILWVTKPTCADVLFPLEETLTEGDCEKGFFFSFPVWTYIGPFCFVLWLLL